MWYWLFKYIFMGPMFIVLGRPKVEGLQHVPSSGPAILASNHLAVADSFYLPLVAAFCFLLPTLYPSYLWGESLWNGFFVCAILRYCFMLNMTWLVNSAVRPGGVVTARARTALSLRPRGITARWRKGSRRLAWRAWVVPTKTPIGRVRSRAGRRPRRLTVGYAVWTVSAGWAPPAGSA